MAEAVKSTPWTWRSVTAYALSLGALNPIGVLAVGFAVALPFMALAGVIEAAGKKAGSAAQECVATCHGHVARFSSEFTGRTSCECR